MAIQIIIRGKNKFGKTRSEQESNLRKEGFIGMDDENYEKCKWLEKKIKEKTGATNGFINQANIGKIFRNDKK